MKMKYNVLLIGLFFTYIGDLIFMTSSAIYIYDQTENAFDVSLIYIVRTISSIILLLIGGSIIDRLNSKIIMVSLDMSRCLIVILFMINLKNLSLLYLIIFIHGALGSFYGTALRVVLKYYSDNLGYTYVNQRFSIIFWFGSIIGTYLSGVLIDKVNYSLPFVIDSLTFFLCGILTLFISFQHHKNNISEEKISLINDFKKSIQVIKVNNILKYIVVFTTIIAIIQTAITSFQIFFVNDILLETSNVYSTIKSIEMLGLCIGSLLFSFVLTKVKNENNLIKFSMIIICLSFVLYSLIAKNIPTAIILIFLYGVGNTLFDILSSNLIQKNVDSNLMGRVSNIMGLLPKIATVITLPVFSFIYKNYGVQVLFNFLSISMILIFFYFYKKFFKSSKSNINFK